MVDWRLKKLLLELSSAKEAILVAIDGPCASGKTTLAKKIAAELDCNVIHTDHFFLRPEQKTAERLFEIGGNLDRERFFEEVLSPLLRKRPFSFRPYDCQKGEKGEEIFVPMKKITVVEGSYSHHPFFGDVYDLRVFLEISPEAQKRRLLSRNPQSHRRFLEEWIPKENAYFEAFSIREKADYILNPK